MINISLAKRMPIIVIYMFPKDYPDKFVARLFDIDVPTCEVRSNKELSELLKEIPKNMTKLNRHDSDDPCILGMYM